jgi:hypothetical protein
MLSMLLDVTMLAERWEFATNMAQTPEGVQLAD